MEKEGAWAAEEIQTLKEMWGNRSATEIGNVLQRTRSAICGKINRLRGEGETLRAFQPAAAKPKKAEKRIRIRKPGDRPMPSPPTQPETFTAPVCEPCTIYDLDDSRCHWPLNIHDHKVTEFYCGGAALFDRPYCAHHTRKAYDRGNRK